ncbi:WecB/TagA/CpsF family glycosyltransferase [Sulfitobacter sabulilitoris]|uniref:WecB/TagA/CpsF family glycosyltransferase n=1 Tax=Sulfitobacter sabulilitoris TaxID=2562655 RepID=A0A5S3P9Q5_9RHOB|nr:WecB/TagA/CpsF family glycosyltransferase [Sulfitobacter sabulilitoris]TMM49314.1 WecB/TagA/CpsF family glycosyltransferase [Sulfitobacter sabulilitoris]
MIFNPGGQEIAINVPTKADLFRRIQEKFSAREGFALATLNLDHLAKLASSPDFAMAYRAQDLVVADGRPVVWLSRLGRRPVELLPGSDLLLPLCALAAETATPVALVGSTDRVLERAADVLRQRIPGIKLTACVAPPHGFDPTGAEAATILQRLETSGAGFCIVALGAVKQERFAAFGRTVAPGIGFACFGAGLDFLAGQQVRAPRIMRAMALEWVWRILQSPGRMIPRYARCFAILPELGADALRLRRKRP